MVVESPKETRNRKLDNALLANFSQIDSAVNQYYSSYKKMPESLSELTGAIRLLSDLNLIDPETKTPIKYSVSGDMEYELCATFRTSNIIKPDEAATFYREYENWSHEAGDQCLKQKVFFDKGAYPTEKIETIPAPVQ
jgi:hypothetical protein